MNRLDAMIILTASLTALFDSALALLGEGRPDVYVSMTILSYFISYALASPDPRPEYVPRVVNIVLLAVFLVIVGYRVYEVLAG